MNVVEILQGTDKLTEFLISKGYSLNKTYEDPKYPIAKFVDIGNKRLVAIYECKREEEIRETKNHFLIDQGLTHCVILYDQRVLFYRNYGEIKYFAYSRLSDERYPFKKDKLEQIGKDFDILFKTKDVSGFFYDLFKVRRDSIVRNISDNMDDIKKYLIAQKIFDRIFFIYFLCHKGIVTFSNQKKIEGKILFRILLDHDDFLTNLYHIFNSFNNENSNQVVIGNYKIQIPYLNGGLFSQDDVEPIKIKMKKAEWEKIFDFLNSYHWIIEDDIEDIENEKILTPEILGHVYERSVVEWEKKGFEKEVEEAIGKSERKTMGVYYTPEYVTDYISENTIIPYVLEKTNRKFLTKDDLIKKANSNELESVLRILDSIKILDPACGSGAFLIQAANEIFKLKSKIQAMLGKKITHYDTKLDIITNNIYGIDILEGAVEIAKLRLWLWLVSSYRQDKDYHALPNIEYNLRVGNTLVGWLNESIGRSLMSPLPKHAHAILENLIKNSANHEKKEFEKANNLLEKYVVGQSYLENYKKAITIFHKIYKKSHGKRSKFLRNMIETIMISIYGSVNPTFLQHVNNVIKPGYTKILKYRYKPPVNEDVFQHFKPFHWKLEFPEVFLLKDDPNESESGFDIVIGNPPYVSNWTLAGNKQVEKEYLKKGFSEVTMGHWDIYIIFIIRSLFLLKDNGILSFIVPSSFFKEKYGKKLRELSVNDYSIISLLDFETEKVFGEVARQFCIFMIRNKSNPDNMTNLVKYQNEHFEESGVIKQKEFLNFHNCTFRTDIQQTDLDVKKKMSQNSILLESICCVNVGVVAHSSKDSPIKFTKDDVIHTSYSKGYKKYLDGKEISRYNVHWGGNFMDYERNKQYFHRSKFPQLFESPKIIVRRVSGENNRIIMVYDENQFYTNDNLIHLILWNDKIIELQNPNKIEIYKPYNDFPLLYLTGIMGSKLISYFFSKFFGTGTLQGTYSGIYPEDLRKIPIKITSQLKKEKLSELVKKMIKLNEDLNKYTSQSNMTTEIRKNIMKIDAEIDEFVYNLYGISDSERVLIEQSFSS